MILIKTFFHYCAERNQNFLFGEKEFLANYNNPPSQQSSIHPSSQPATRQSVSSYVSCRHE